MDLIKKLHKAYREASVVGRIAIVVAVCLALWWIAYIAHTVVVPWIIRILCCFVHWSLMYMMVAAFVALFAPSAGAKMFRLYWQLIETAVLDPLLSLTGQKKTKKK